MFIPWKRTAVVLTVLSLVSTSSAFAFSDLKGDPNEAKIEALQQAGIIDGVGNDRFAPAAHVTVAQGVQLLVKGFGLNIDNIRFIKKPEASDYFANVPDDAWFAQTFIIAALNGLDLPNDINPGAELTREQFAHYLYKAMIKTSTFPVTKQLIEYADQQEVNPAYREDIQTLLKIKVVQLNADGRFLPKEPLLRSEAAVELHDALQFLRGLGDVSKPSPSDVSVQLTIEKVTDDVNRVTLNAGIQPNPGYYLSVDRITFKEDGTARIDWTLHQPDPGKIYAQVMTEAKAVTYIDSRYKPMVATSGAPSPTTAHPVIGGSAIPDAEQHDDSLK